jgi:hypothetical protein
MRGKKEMREFEKKRKRRVTDAILVMYANGFSTIHT